MLVNCQFCEREFTTYPSRLKDGRGKFCSRACYAKWQSENKRGENNPHWQGGKITFVCEICETEFEVFPSVADWNGSRFCSNACAGKWRSQHLRGSNNPRWNGGQIAVTCVQCGAEFESPKCWIERGHSKFCSKACEGRWRAENLTGEKAGGWQGGLSFQPYSWHFNDNLKRYIRKRDNYTCAICGKKRVSPVHHIDYNKLRSCPENLIVLCRKCHARTNHNRRFWRTILAPVARGREREI